MNESIMLQDDGNTVLIQNLTVRDENVYKFLSGVDEDRRLEYLVSAIRIGVIGLKRMAVGEELDYVEKEFTSLMQRFDKNFDPKFAHKNDQFKDLFLKNKLTFTNFYPSVKNKIYLPVPNSIVKKKNSEEYLDLSFIKDRPKDDDLVKLQGLLSLAEF